MEHTTKHLEKTHDDHGSVTYYIIGFILSLIFTIIPYYLVTEEVFETNILLYAIFGIGILQMFVQIFFFLHLGRGPKPLYNVVFFGATAGLIVLVVGASVFIMNNLYRNMSPQEVTMRIAQEENIDEINGIKTGACQGNNANHSVTVIDGRVNPELVTAKRCDTLTLTSTDGLEHQIIFLVNGKEVSYGGIYEVTVRPDRSKIITLNEIGDFTFNTTEDSPTSGRFVVEP